MEIYLICLAAALIGGLMLSRVTKRLNLPAVTAYLVAGLLLGPFCLGGLKIPGFGFNTLHQVETMSIVTQTALGFIAFTIGNEFRLSQLRATGAKAITIGILQAVITTVVVDVVLIGMHLCFPSVISIPSTGFTVIGLVCWFISSDRKETLRSSKRKKPTLRLHSSFF